ncbi:MAG: hypothetical protein KDJ97_26325 [Anaerolineae bacterium]|nr:hypothetical protein [Anaerolineae bacterium]
MLLINFAHPVSPAQVARIEDLTGRKISRLIERPVHFDPDQTLAAQTVHLVDAVGLTAEAWQQSPLLLNLPSLNFGAAVLLAELHGRCGYFPAVLRWRPRANRLPPEFEVAEVINLQAVRDQARLRRHQDDETELAR